MTKAENIFKDTRFSIIQVWEEHGCGGEFCSLSDRWRLAGWCYGDTPKGQQFMSQRTLNAIKKLVEKEERRLYMNDKYGISQERPEWAAKCREAVRVLKDMIAETQAEYDREKEERRARKSMSYDEFMAKYYPQYC